MDDKADLFLLKIFYTLLLTLPIHNVASVNDRFGNPMGAYYFDGSTSYIEVPDAPSLDPDRISISLWVNYDGGTRNPRVFSKGSPADQASYALFQQNEGYVSAMVQFRKDGYPSPNFSFADTFTTNQWQHFVIERDIDSVRIYIDNHLAGAWYFQGPLETSTAHLVFGAHGGTIGTGQDYFRGMLDDIRIYNRSLSLDEIETLYHENGWQQLTGDLIAYYPFNGNASDESGNHHDGVTNGGITWVADRFGNPSSAALFDGNTGYVSITDPNAELTFDVNNDAFAISTWVYFTSIPNRFIHVFMDRRDAGPFSYQIDLDGRTNYDYRRLSTSVFDGANGFQVLGHTLIDTDVWYNIVVTVSNDSCRIFLNGTLEASTRIPSNLGSSKATDHIENIGTYFNTPTSPVDFMTGVIDDIRIYGRSISSAQIDSLFHERGFGNCEKPVISGLPNAYGGTFQCLGELPLPPIVTASDCHGTVALIYNQSESNPGSSFNNTISRTWTATNQMGTTSFTQKIRVNDTTPPTIAFPRDTSLPENIFGQCGAAVILGSPSASDNCTVTVTGVRSDAKSLNDPYPLGTTNITWTATDGSSNQASCLQKITVTNPAPVVSITNPPSGSLYAIGTTINFAGSYTDNAGGTHTATWTADANSFVGTVNEGAQTVSASYTFTVPGVYLMKLTVEDGCGMSGTSTSVSGLDAIVVVYDPNAGFVTGGGWINSPSGAYRADTMLVGKANFGFVSKYQKGKTVPTGETEFQFKVGNLNFHSSVYDWLVVTGAKAQYKGTGTINNVGNYGFMLTATDGALTGGGGVDKFRMKIWDKSNADAIVYDNRYGSSDNSDPTTAIASGSIIIHSSLAKYMVTPTEAITPESYALNPNFPNPFNPTTTIKYSLLAESKVRLVILDVLGREITTLIDGVEEAGFKSATWNAGNAASGMYFYKIEASSVADSKQNFTQIRKMLLVR